MMRIVAEKVEVYGAQWCADCKRVCAFLAKNGIKLSYVNISMDSSVASHVEKLNDGKRIIPTVLIDGKKISNPTNEKLSKVLGINDNFRIVFYGADWCPDCRKTKLFLQLNKLNYYYVDIDENPDAAQVVEKINKGKRIIPTLLVNNIAIPNPKNEQLRELFNIEAKQDSFIYDVAILGAGAAGLTTSIYCQRDKLNTLVLEKNTVGGNAALTSKIENYPGFVNVSGPELMNRMADQATTYGAKIETGVEVKYILKEEDEFKIVTDNGNFYSRSVVVATGSTYRRLNIPGENELIGSGIHFCATCDGAFYRNKEVIVIGGGNSALEEALFLSSFCKRVKIIHRSPEFKASPTIVEKVKLIDNLEIFCNYKPKSFNKNESGNFHSLTVQNNLTGENMNIEADGVFIFIGLKPNTAFLNEIVELNDDGSIITTGLNESNIPGIFAAGDCRKGAIAQVASATGEGVVASYGIREFFKFK